MKINNIDEFTEIFDFAFSREYEQLGNSEKKAIKTEIESALKKNPELNEIIRKKLKEEILKVNYFHGFYGAIPKITFIYKMLSNEEKIEFLIKNFIYAQTRIDREYLMFILLDFLSLEDRVKVLSKLTNAELLNLMSMCNQTFLTNGKKIEMRLKYKKYYFILKKALDHKELR